MLQDKTIVVTGGAGLIGTAYCKAIASAGGRPVVADIDASAAETLAEEIGPSAAALSLDIADVRSVQAMIRSLTDRFGGIDGIVNNAYPRNKNYGRHVEDVDYLDFCENLSLHLGGISSSCSRWRSVSRRSPGGAASSIWLRSTA